MKDGTFILMMVGRFPHSKIAALSEADSVSEVEGRLGCPDSVDFVLGHTEAKIPLPETAVDSPLPPAGVGAFADTACTGIMIFSRASLSTIRPTTSFLAASVFVEGKLSLPLVDEQVHDISRLHPSIGVQVSSFF